MRKIIFWIGTPVRLLFGAMCWVVIALMGIKGGGVDWKKLIMNGFDEGMK